MFTATLHGGMLHDVEELESELLMDLEELVSKYTAHLSGSWFKGETIGSTNLTNPGARGEVTIDSATGEPHQILTAATAEEAVNSVNAHLETATHEEATKLHGLLTEMINAVKDHLHANPPAEPEPEPVVEANSEHEGAPSGGGETGVEGGGEADSTTPPIEPAAGADGETGTGTEMAPTS